MFVCCSCHCILEISTKGEVLRFNPVIFEILSDSRIISPWMDFRLLEIVCVMLVILAEFISLRQSSVMSSILPTNQRGPLIPFRVFINLHPTTVNHRTHYLASSVPINISTYSLPATIPSPHKPFSFH